MRPNVRQMPPGFAEDARTMTQAALARKYRCGYAVLSRWLDEIDFHRGPGNHKRPVAQYDPDTGERVAVYGSIAEAARAMYGQLKSNCSNICQCCRGTVPTACGWRWEYAEDK